MPSVFGKKHRVVIIMGLAVGGFLALGATNSAAQGFRWPEEPQNLKVLPKEVKGARLGEVMRDFTTALGVRCEHCHVGEGSDLSKFDFPSDEKMTKRKARIMIQMVQAINQTHLAKVHELDPSEKDPVEVTCMTCHRTATQPRMLDDVLAKTIETDGVDAAITQYRDLRKKFYGGFVYDFSRGTLTGLGERLASGGNVDAALRILDLETEMNGESASIYFTRGRIEAGAGMRDEALKSFERGLEIAPEGWKPFFQRQIDRLRQPKP